MHAGFINIAIQEASERVAIYTFLIKEINKKIAAIT
jgi:hypothetical protein